MKRVKFSKEALLSLDAILHEMGITPHEDFNTNEEFDGTIIGYDGKAISIEEALSLFDIHSSKGFMTDEEKQAVREISNFDPDVFKEITGIDVNE